MSSGSPLLSLFKEQLEAECKEIKDRLSLPERGHALVWWYFTKLHGFTDTEVEEIFCDGGGDLGIDAIWIDDEQFVHFYQFKNPESLAKGIPAGDIDKTISGLSLILEKKHGVIANNNLKARLEEIYTSLPSGYQLHIVSSGDGIPPESEVKLDTFSAKLNRPSVVLFDWQVEKLSALQDRFYQKSLPAIETPIVLDVTNPHTARSGNADCYLFHVAGTVLADLYKLYGEGLLQRNIRVDQGDTATNRSIEATCVGGDSASFLHFNNGVTFLCETASYDSFCHQLTLRKAQLVNGGQTIRAIYRAHSEVDPKSWTVGDAD